MWETAWNYLSMNQCSNINVKGLKAAFSYQETLCWTNEEQKSGLNKSYWEIGGECPLLEQNIIIYKEQASDYFKAQENDLNRMSSSVGHT